MRYECTDRNYHRQDTVLHCNHHLEGAAVGSTAFLNRYSPKTVRWASRGIFRCNISGVASFLQHINIFKDKTKTAYARRIDPHLMLLGTYLFTSVIDPSSPSLYITLHTGNFLCFPSSDTCDTFLLFLHPLPHKTLPLAYANTPTRDSFHTRNGTYLSRCIPATSSTFSNAG